MPSRGSGQRRTSSWSICACASRPTARRSPSAAGRSGSRAGACDASGVGRRADRARTGRPHPHARRRAPLGRRLPPRPAGAVRRHPRAHPLPQGRPARAAGSRPEPGAGRGRVRLRAAGRPRHRQLRGRGASTSTPRPSSSTGSRSSTGCRARSGATATSAPGASPTAASRASSSPRAGRRRCARSPRCTRPTTATPTTCTTTAARWRRSSSATTRSA